MRRFWVVMLAGGLGVWLVLVPRGTAEAIVINVPDDQPTIQAGIDAAVSGDTILIAPGTYQENVVIDGSAVTVIGDTVSGGVVIQSAVSSTPVLSLSNGTSGAPEIVGLVIENAELAAGINCQDSHVRLRKNEIRNNTGSGVWVGPTDLPETTLVADNYIHHNVSGRGGGIYITETDASILRNNFENNSASVYGGGLYLY
jgi:pectin methylesterase-like acyl-CoA thioesterase